MKKGRITKTQLMDLVKEGKYHETFEHSDSGLFDITAMRDFAKKHEIEPVLVRLSEILPYVKTTRASDNDRVLELSEEDCLKDPGMVVNFTADYPPSMLYIDGTHRALRLEMMGEEYQLVYMLDAQHIVRPGKGWVLIDSDSWGDTIIRGKKLVSREADTKKD